MKGKVFLVGAGPGDPELLTLKGRRLLEQAEVVVFDRLVNPALLAMLPKEAEAIDVGKSPGCHPVPQEQINRLLLEKALAGKRVVRLKGGDPFLFGRGGEELELLRAHGVPFQVVPGVSSALAVPAYAGIPVTHREFSSSLHILTGHAKAGASPGIDFEALCRLGGTLVFLMGISALPQICKGLLEAGMTPQTPAAVIERGTLPRQRKVLSSLEELPRAAERAAIENPAVIVVGEACRLSQKLDWFSQLPLLGKRVVVTRPAERAGGLSEKLRRLGADVMEYPCIAVVPRESCPQLEEAIAALHTYRWLVFTSPGGPPIFFHWLKKAGKDARYLAGLKLGAIGPKTAGALREYGLEADLVPQTYDSAHLAQAMAGVEGPVLLCRASRGSSALPELFAAQGIPFTDIPCYDTVYQSPNAGLLLEWLEEPLAVTFTSASTVEGFVKSLPPGTCLSRVLGYCIGPKTAAEAEKRGIAVRVAKEATVETLAACLLEQENKGGNSL